MPAHNLPALAEPPPPQASAKGPVDTPPPPRGSVGFGRVGGWVLDFLVHPLVDVDIEIFWYKFLAFYIEIHRRRSENFDVFPIP